MKENSKWKDKLDNLPKERYDNAKEKSKNMLNYLFEKF